MALKINLKGGDSLLIGTSRLTIAGEGYTTIVIEGDIPIMRESESIGYDDASTPAKLFLFHIQQCYLVGDNAHLDLAKDSMSELADTDIAAAREVLILMAQGKQFKALRLARALAGL
jgi:flagellar biosynthesis regulator FlbT